MLKCKYLQYTKTLKVPPQRPLTWQLLMFPNIPTKLQDIYAASSSHFPHLIVCFYLFQIFNLDSSFDNTVSWTFDSVQYAAFDLISVQYAAFDVMTVQYAAFDVLTVQYVAFDVISVKYAAIDLIHVLYAANDFIFVWYAALDVISVHFAALHVISLQYFTFDVITGRYGVFHVSFSVQYALCFFHTVCFIWPSIWFCTILVYVQNTRYRCSCKVYNCWLQILYSQLHLTLIYAARDPVSTVSCIKFLFRYNKLHFAVDCTQRQFLTSVILYSMLHLVLT